MELRVLQYFLAIAREETTPGAAARVFTVLGENNIHFYQVTTSKRTISFIIDKNFKDLAITKINEEFGLNK